MQKSLSNINIEKKKREIESEVVKVIKNTEYTLNTINNYGDNLLHISAANGCYNITKEILTKIKDLRIIDRKNKFGWTPLMQAVRNRDINTTKLLLERNSNVNESTYLGMSVLGLAAAINNEMFQTVYNFCPSALTNASNDDISPLCIAAMKNDKNLFFTLIDLGVDIFKTNKYTHIMMKQSVIPEIAKLAELQLDDEDYWNDISDNIEVEKELNFSNELKVKIENNDSSSHVKKRRNDDIVHSEDIHDRKCGKKNILPNTTAYSNICVGPFNLPINIENTQKKKPRKLLHVNLLSEPILREQYLISPNLIYNCDKKFPTSPNICFMQNNSNVDSNIISGSDYKNKSIIQNKEQSKCSTSIKRSHNSSPILKRLQIIRPPDLNIIKIQDDPNVTLEFLPEFSPTRTPHLPTDINDENTFGENTPTPPRCKTPPKGMVLNSRQTKMVLLLKHFKLSHHVSTFLEQEVDTDLFLTLSDNDLKEIGIENETDRKALLAVINKYKN